MNRASQKAARTETGAAPAVFDLRGRVPGLDDNALASLHANALRLKDDGTTRQRASVETLLPVIESELAQRRERKRAAAPPPKAPRVAKKKAKTAA